jgi:hypothetical protein
MTAAYTFGAKENKDRRDSSDLSDIPLMDRLPESS